MTLRKWAWPAFWFLAGVQTMGLLADAADWSRTGAVAAVSRLVTSGPTLVIIAYLIKDKLEKELK